MTDVRNLKDGFPERFGPDEIRRGGWTAPDHFARYLFAAHFAPGRHIADLCCGAGYGTNLLLATGALRVRGVDVDPDAICVARRHYTGPEFVVARADQPMDLDGFDLRVCFEGIEHVTDPEQLLDNMRGPGVGLISTPNAELFEGGFSGNPHHVREWTRSEFDAMLRKHFAEVRMYCQWYHPSPFDQAWSVRAATKAIIPVAAKARMRRAADAAGARLRLWSSSAESQLARDTSGTDLPTPWDHRVYPASYTSVVPPGLRYGKPHTWVAVCRS